MTAKAWATDQRQMMVTMMLLVVSAVTLFVNPTPVSSRHVHRSAVIHHNLNQIYDLAENCSASRTKDLFVEDVSHLTEGRNSCGDRFFCKVQDILQNLEDFCDRQHKERLVRTLQMYNNGTNVQCQKTLQEMTSARYYTGISRLLEHVKRCVQWRNFRN